MTIKSFCVSTAIVAGLGVGGYAAYIQSFTKFLEPMPDQQAERYFKALNQNVAGKGSARHFTFAYRAPTVVPTHRDMAEVFGAKAVAKQASYVAADGAKKVGTIFAEKKGNAALGSLFALQSLEKATPLCQLRSMALFWDNFQVSRQWNYFLHNRKATMAGARDAVMHASSASDAAKLAQEYCTKVEALTNEKSVKVHPELRMAIMEETCGTTVAASIELPSKTDGLPREANLCVFYSAPVPEGVAEGSYNYKLRQICGDWYTRWLAVNATSALAQL